MALDRRLIFHFDWTIFFLTIAIAGVGMTSVISAAYPQGQAAVHPLIVRQLIWIGAGGLLMAMVVLFDYRALSTYAYLFYGIAVALLVAVSLVGQTTGGSRRWINFGVFKVEPSEIAKLALVLVLVRYMTEEPSPGGLRLRHIVFPGLLLAVPAILVLKQPDLGTMLILMLVFGTL